MVQQLLPLLPKELGQVALVAALTGTVIGAVLWLLGARFSRPLITLLAVGIGAVVGRQLPAWMNWNVNSMAASVGGAVVLGMSGYILHRVWVGLGLGLLLALWAAAATWVFAGGAGTPFAWPVIDATTTWPSLGQSMWDQLPDQVRKLLPYACGGATVSGFLLSLIWPKFGTVMLYSALGTSLVVVLGLLTIEATRPGWMDHVPSQTWAQVATLLGLVAFGAIIQWQTAPSRPAGAVPTTGEE
jgi:hypothetical protein